MILRRAFLRAMLGFLGAAAFGGMALNNARRSSIVVLPADVPKRLKLGWIIYEEVGIGVINDYAVAKVQMGE